MGLTTTASERTSPVTAFPPNGYGVHDMIGNVWEWTPTVHRRSTKRCTEGLLAIPENPRGGAEAASTYPCQSEYQKNPPQGG